MDFNTTGYMERNAFQILPTEICKMITDCLKNDGSSRDLLNLSDAFKRFEIILSPTKTEWKFHSVFPFIIPYLRGSQILNCRTVCKSWRRDVDTILSELDTWQPFDKQKSDISQSNEYNPLQMKRIKWTTFGKIERIEKYQTEMRNQSMRASIVGGSLALREPKLLSNNSNTFWKKSVELLSQSGDQILHLLLEPTDIEPRQFFCTLGQMLRYTPKLKTLQFDGYFSLNVMDYTDSEDQETRSKTLLEYLEENPIPRVSSLQTLELFLFSNHFPVQVFQKLITDVCPTDLKCLKLRYYTGEPEMYNIFTLQHSLANLTELHLLNIKNEEELERVLDSVVDQNTPIAKLVVEFDDFLDDIDFDRMCTAINKLRMTLTKLVIVGVHHENYNDEPQQPTLRRLDTPNLRSIELEGVVFDNSIQLPVLSHSLEYLHIRCTNTLRNINQFFQWLLSYTVNKWPEKNPFWNEMGKLKVIKLDILNERITMERGDGFANIGFRNVMGLERVFHHNTLTNGFFIH